MTRYRPLNFRVTLGLTIALVVTAGTGACSSRQNDVAFSQGGDQAMGGSGTQAGSGTAGASAGATAQAGSGAAGANNDAGGPAAGGKGSGGASAAGTAGVSAGSSGEAGAASVGGAASASCDEGCTDLCEGGMCMCSCPTITLTCPNQVQTLEQWFSSACKVDDDCFGAEHYVGCCRVSVVGLNVSQREGFAAWEKDTCHNPPVCGCAIDTLTTEDGKMIKREMSYAVHCVAGKCASWVP
jgi:hypothetical protein